MHPAALPGVRRGQRRAGARCHSRLAHPSPCSTLPIWWESWRCPWVQYFGETQLGRLGGSISGWDVPLGRTIPPSWVLEMGPPSTEGSGVIAPTPPLPPQRHPAFFYLFQSVISIINIIFLPRLPSQHQPQLTVSRGDSAHTKGEMWVCHIPCFSPNVTWGCRISHHITAALCSLQCHGYGSLPAPAASLSFQGALCHGYFKHLMQGF